MSINPHYHHTENDCKTIKYVLSRFDDVRQVLHKKYTRLEQKNIASQVLHIATREGRKITIFLVKELDYKENTEYTCLKEIPVKQRLKG